MAGSGSSDPSTLCSVGKHSTLPARPGAVHKSILSLYLFQPTQGCCVCRASSTSLADDTADEAATLRISCFEEIAVRCPGTAQAAQPWRTFSRNLPKQRLE